MRNWLNTLLFLSAFSPALVSVALVRYWDKGFDRDVACYASAGVLGISLAISIIAAIKKHGEIIAFSAKRIESNDAMLIGVVWTYFVPFLGKAADTTSGVLFIFILAVSAVFLVSYASVSHSMLRFLGFRFYKAESSTGVVYTLITKRELLGPKNIKTVKQISSTILVEVL